MRWEVETWKMKMTFSHPLKSLGWGLGQDSPPIGGMWFLHSILWGWYLAAASLLGPALEIQARTWPQAKMAQSAELASSGTMAPAGQSVTSSRVTVTMAASATWWRT